MLGTMLETIEKNVYYYDSHAPPTEAVRFANIQEDQLINNTTENGALTTPQSTHESPGVVNIWKVCDSLQCVSRLYEICRVRLISLTTKDFHDGKSLSNMGSGSK